MKRHAPASTQMLLSLRWTIAVPTCEHAWIPREDVAWSSPESVVSWRCLHCRALGRRVSLGAPILAQRCGTCCCLEFATNLIDRGAWCSKHTRRAGREAHHKGLRCPQLHHAMALRDRIQREDLDAARARGEGTTYVVTLAAAPA